LRILITYAEKNFTSEEVYGLLLPFVKDWFIKQYGDLTPVQRKTIPLVKESENVLVSSPTGTGKTLAVFLGIIDNIYQSYLTHGTLPEGVYAVYVSPLRALNNDMRKNLIEPIKGIRETAKIHGVDLPEIEVMVRTSDTPPSEKQRMARKPPHILITTPETLAIALNAPKFRERLKNTRVVIIDEIHELASSKRGSHLSLSIERLENLAGRKLQRVGLSATISPLEEVAAFLVGYRDDGELRDCVIVDARFDKKLDIKLLMPVSDLIRSSAEELNEAIYNQLLKVIKRHKTTLIFTNTRSATERVVFKLKKTMEKSKIIDIDDIEAHHSSLSRDVRLDIENKLKNGLLKAVVSSTSLELGIDIGYIDVVVLLSSPRSVTRLLQRVGRAGHHIREVSKGRIVVVDRDDLMECAVLAKLALERKIDRIRIPKNPLDVLAQHIVGLSLERKWGVEEALRLVKRSYSFHKLTKEDFMSVLKYLAGELGDFYEYQRVYSKIWFDEEEGVFGRKKTSRMIYYQNIGVIPDESKAHVFTTDGKYVGDLEEGFVEYLAPGDLFVLGGRVYEYLGSKGFKVEVRPADGLRPTVPSWFSEMLPLAYDSALEIGKFRRMVSDWIDQWDRGKVVKEIMKNYHLTRDAAETIYEYVKLQKIFTNAPVPSDKVILIEVYDEPDKRNIIVHSLFGRRANDALARIYAYYVGEKLGADVKITVTDNGFMVSIPGHPILNWSGVLTKIPTDAEKLYANLVKVLRRTELIKRRFRHVAVRSFMLLRRYRNAEKSISKLQVNAEELLKAVEEIENFPVLKETYREILMDYMHLDEAIEVLEKIWRNEIEVVEIGPVDVPSPFAHNIVVHGYSDVVLMEDMRKLLRRLHERVLEKLRGSFE
jgi:ATP-dependent Lhr-like helicase